MRASFIAAFFLSGISFTQAAHSAQLVRGPYTENPGLDSAVVRWRVDVPTVAWLSYGVAPVCNQFNTISPEAHEHAVSLFGLNQSSEYCYKIFLPVEGQNGVVAVATGTFRTLRPPEENAFEFLAFGDSGGGTGAQADIGAQLEKYSPDFVLHTGDLTEDGQDAAADEKFFRPFSGILRKAPFFIALGNHEYAPPKTPAKITAAFLKTNFLPFHQMTPGQGSPHYYAFTTANALFVALDDNRADQIAQAPDFAPGSPQYTWLEATLAKSAADWKFVFLHVPIYSSGGHGTNQTLVKTLAPLLEQYGVDIVFQGHDHNYERTQPIKNGAVSPEDGVMYITLGGGGSPLYIQCSQNGWSEKFLSAYSFGDGVMTGDSFTFTAYDKENKPLDSVTITK